MRTKTFKNVIVLQVVTESYQRKEGEKITSGPKGGSQRFIPRESDIQETKKTKLSFTKKARIVYFLLAMVKQFLRMI